MRTIVPPCWSLRSSSSSNPVLDGGHSVLTRDDLFALRLLNPLANHQKGLALTLATSKTHKCTRKIRMMMMMMVMMVIKRIYYDYSYYYEYCYCICTTWAACNICISSTNNIHGNIILKNKSFFPNSLFCMTLTTLSGKGSIHAYVNVMHSS